MKHAIYIPTKNRLAFVLRALEAWSRYNIPIVVTVERQYQASVVSLKQWDHGKFKDVIIHYLSEENRGIGWARHKMLQHARQHGVVSYLMADDDQIPAGDPVPMLKLATRRDVVGIGAYKSIYGLLCSGTKMVQAFKCGKVGTYLHKGSMGHMMEAINVQNALNIGGYDYKLSSYEDHELCRQSIMHGMPWYIHTGMRASDMIPAKYLRFFGGIYTLFDTRAEIRKQAHTRIHQRWPDFVSDPANGPYRCYWQKMITHCMGQSVTWPLEDIEIGSRPFAWRQGRR